MHGLLNVKLSGDSWKPDVTWHFLYRNWCRHLFSNVVW